MCVPTEKIAFNMFTEWNTIDFKHKFWNTHTQDNNDKLQYCFG
jgi:hypothetical protein